MKDERKSSMKRMVLLELFGFQNAETGNKHREKRMEHGDLKRSFATQYSRVAYHLYRLKQKAKTHHKDEVLWNETIDSALAIMLRL
jgi:hypothetical protein